jgi:hypothetical protein
MQEIFFKHNYIQNIDFFKNIIYERNKVNT